MVLKDFLILIVVYFKVAFASLEHFKDDQPRCHLQTIPCPCERRHGEQFYVTMRKCAGDLNVCNGKAVITKCRIAYLAQKRQRRDISSQNFNCHNGTIILPADSSPAIKAPPSVSINGLSKNVLKNRDVKFQCKVVSNLAANVTWLFNGLPLAEQMDHRHSYSNCRMILHIQMVLNKDSGNYTCVVQNEIGQAMATSHLAVIRKHKGPYIQYMRLEGKTGSNTAVVGSSLNLTCESQNVEVLNFFKKDGTKVHEGDRSHYEVHNIPEEGRNAKVSKLEIKNVTFDDTGNYTCVAWFDSVTMMKTFYLRIVNASQSCIAGYYCPPGSHQPLKCPAGTYQPSTGALSKDDCRPCDPGYYCSLPGSELPDGPCHPGYRCPLGSKFPDPCPWGSYQPLAGASTCEKCKNGNFSKKPDYYINPAVNVSDCPPGYHPTGGSGSEMGKEQQSSTASHISSVEIIGIVFGILGAVVITLLALICIARKTRWMLSYKAKTTSSNQHDLESSPCEMIVAHSELNGLCGETSNVQYSQVVKRPPEKDYDAKYDVFICYSSKDTNWVKELLAELEKRGFVCCIDFKDFTVGAAIVENIAQAIYYSRKTVAVLSPDFVNSEWCSHELQKALTRIRSHQVVPIVYKNCAIPLLLQDRTYLDWENCHVKPYFWKQLEKALRLPNDDVICFDEPVTNPADQLVL